MSSVLFIYPPVSFLKRNPLSGFSPPLGILYLATILKNKGHEVHVIDAEAERLSLNELIEKVKSLHPEVVGLTCLTNTFRFCKSIIKEIKRISNAYIVVGGPHISVAGPRGNLGADAYVAGEAELVIEKIVDERPKGMIFSKEIREIDTIPFPDRTFVRGIKYGKFFGLPFCRGATAILTTRGCRFGCSFCNRPRKAGFRARSPRSIIQELKEIERAGYETVLLADDNFSNDPENVMRLARLVRKERIKLNFFGETRVDTPIDALYRSMREMGVVGLSFGVESLSPKVIGWYNKTKYPTRWSAYVKKSLNLCQKYGIISCGSLIFGAPMETKEEMEHSIQFLQENGIDLIHGNVLLYLIGSRIWRWAVSIGRIRQNQFMVSAAEAKLTPYSQDELEELCIQCSKFCKEQGWRRCFLKLLKNHQYKIIYDAIKGGIESHPLIRKKLLSKGPGYGYTKAGRWGVPSSGKGEIVSEGGLGVSLPKIKLMLRNGEELYESLNLKQRGALMRLLNSVVDYGFAKVEEIHTRPPGFNPPKGFKLRRRKKQRCQKK